MNDKEIELKFVINKEIKEQIIKDLEPITIQTSTKRLVDTYYIPNFKEFEIDGKTIECVRVRESDKGSVLTYKKIHYESNPIYCDEYETEVLDAEQMQKILFALGFKIQMVIDKVRQTFKTQNFEFDFDSVKNLGELLEVELKNEDSTIDDIYNFVLKYGLTKNNVTYDGIQVMMKKAIKK